MHLSPMDCAILETHGRDALSFPPPPRAVPAAQASMLSNRSACGDRLDVAYGADEFKIHPATLACRANGPAHRDSSNAQAERPASSRAAPACCWTATPRRQVVGQFEIPPELSSNSRTSWRRGYVSHDARFVLVSLFVDPHSAHDEISDRGENAHENHEP